MKLYAKWKVARYRKESQLVILAMFHAQEERLTGVIVVMLRRGQERVG
jgi:hypothetical protein